MIVRDPAVFEELIDILNADDNIEPDLMNKLRAY
jgi:hypothetical protein